ncbi:DC-STAMP domain-containing protein 1 [Collichthys lucidus]|uniref:DC-STAMP domain-containing protein 1 n=1 Tax=Collichthys lucidus TaxID=240159 RepID=A0A4U5V805_COLLU|nr:DC-STAMP domain-containing protein 1 [Collichthys lucidus]
MTPWCRQQIPVEGNFGQLFDQLNLSVELLSREFSTELVVQEQQQQEVLGGALLDQEFTQAVRRSFNKLTSTMEQLLDALQLLLSFTFITIFTQQYLTDVRFDNIYITTYFRLIDARRRRAGKRCLLPLEQSEKKLIDPCSPKIHPEELKQVVDIRVGGDSMMARLLRKTVSAFNSSSSLDIQTDNQGLSGRLNRTLRCPDRPNLLGPVLVDHKLFFFRAAQITVRTGAPEDRSTAGPEHRRTGGPGGCPTL